MPKYHAKNVEGCWKIARQVAEAYQRRLNRMGRKKGSTLLYLICKEGRDAADRIAMKIRTGRRRG